MPYEDLIHLSRPQSSHPKMPRENRAAIFAPFAALSGYAESIQEINRQTEEKIELDEGAAFEIDMRLREAVQNWHTIKVKYFVPDEKKAGGRYETCVGKIKRVDRVSGVLEMDTGERVVIAEIVGVERESERDR